MIYVQRATTTLGQAPGNGADEPATTLAPPAPPAPVAPPNGQRRLRNSTAWAIVWAVLGTASMAASAFHGYRRNRSVGWAVVWALLGGMFPVLTPTVALAQGFGQRKG